MERLLKRRKITLDSPPETSLGTTDSQAILSTSFEQAENQQNPFPDGVKVLHDVKDAIVDICFLHGLTGNRDSTWTAKGQQTPWPAALLPSIVQKARILTYGYDAYVVRKSATASKNRLIDHAKNFLTDLSNDREEWNAVSRPLIIVAHSMGGLVCKKAILLSRNHPEDYLRDIFDSLRGIIFMGSPHKGSWMADWASIPVSALGLLKSTNKFLLEILETDNQLLEAIQDEFLSMLREQQCQRSRTIGIACVFEELSMHGSTVVVPKSSAIFLGYSYFSIHANHGDMVKFASTEDNGFKRVSGVLKRWHSQIGKN